jgi:hypothetical protein
MAQKELGGFGELAALQAAALFLDVAELLYGFLKLTGEARAMQTEPGELRDGLGGGVLRKQLGFEEWDAVDAPGSVGDFVDQLSLGGGGGLILIEKLLDVALVSGSSVGRTAIWAVRPWRNALSDERCLPGSVRGPVECSAFARFARVRGSGIRDWGAGIGVADIGGTSEPG